MDLGLTGKVAVLTGASKGIGYCSALALAREGANISICARGQEGLDAAAPPIRDETGVDVLTVTADMGVREDARRLMQATADHFGNIDILVNCAGSLPGGLLLDITEEQWFTSMNLKFLGYVRAMTEVIPHLLRERRRADRERDRQRRREADLLGADARRGQRRRHEHDAGAGGAVRARTAS